MELLLLQFMGQLGAHMKDILSDYHMMEDKAPICHQLSNSYKYHGILIYVQKLEIYAAIY